MTSHLLTVTTAAVTDLDLPQLTTLTGLAFLTWRALLVALFPFTACGRCEGRGRFARGDYWRPCHRCAGTGRRLRFGRRVWRWATRDRD